eukprot:4017082-Prymnesium_polylepis.1
MGLHTHRAGAAIGWRSQILLAQVRVACTPTCPCRCAASSRTPIWRRTARSARAQKQAGRAMPAMRPARG